jgi:hypothetical protein
VLDIHGKQRGERLDIGCFQASDEPLTHVPLTGADVGRCGCGPVMRRLAALLPCDEVTLYASLLAAKP